MATCPNCGEIVMDGDPYCSHCGSTLHWANDDDSSSEDASSDLYELYDFMVKSDLTSDEKFDLFKKYIFMPDHMLEEIRESIHETEKLYKCRFIMVYTKDFPQTYVFLRQDKYRDVMIFERCYIEYSPTRFDPDRCEFHYIYEKLYNNPKFRSEVERIEREGLKFKEVYSNIVTPIWANDITVKFLDGNKVVYYDIDDDLNFKKPF